MIRGILDEMYEVDKMQYSLKPEKNDNADRESMMEKFCVSRFYISS